MDELVEVKLLPKKQRKDKKVLTFEERINVILEHEQSSPSARILSEKYGCGKTQILNILRNREEYLEQWRNSKPRHVRRPSGLFVSLGVILNEWVERAKAYNKIITDDDLRRTSKEISSLLNIPSFYPSNRWLERFKNKYNITDDNMKTNPNYGISLKRKSLKLEDIIVDINVTLSSNVLMPVGPNDETEIHSSQYLSSISSDDDNNSSNMEYFLPNMQSTSSMNQQFYDTGENEAMDFVEATFDENQHNSEEISSQNNENENQIELSSYSEVLEHLKALESFAMEREDIRAIGLINQLENYLKKKADEEY